MFKADWIQILLPFFPLLPSPVPFLPFLPFPFLLSPFPFPRFPVPLAGCRLPLALPGLVLSSENSTD